MCGITGIFDTSRRMVTSELDVAVRRMTRALVYRGPDDEGVWVEAVAGLALGHRRLSILDVSPHGHQPMVSHDGRYVVAFNGEIYNFQDLRHDLDRQSCGQAIPWRGHSDTEVLLAAVSRWGVQEAVQRLNGMFAIALWDRQERELHLIRDRMGEKPLYYGWVGPVLLFGSELKALLQHPDCTPTISRDVLRLFLRYNYVPNPYSIYEGMSQLSPGMILSLSGVTGKTASPVPYWSVAAAATRGASNLVQSSVAETVDELDRVLREAVHSRMVADVPLGAFLSGGIDSTTVVAMMQAASGRPVKTFCIGLDEPGSDESGYARAVAAHLGTEHTELKVTAADAMAAMAMLPARYDEPFADPSSIPTCLVSALARKSVTVSLSGDGGDELFAGYNHYALGRRVWSRIGWIPFGLRQSLARRLCAATPETWTNLLGGLSALLPRTVRPRTPGEKLHKLAEVLQARSSEEMHHGAISHWGAAVSPVIGGQELPVRFMDPRQWEDLSGPVARMMLMDMLGFLPDDILVKLDRASMGVSLETRVPFLDHRVVEYAWRIPLSMKLREGQGKWILRQVLYRYVPRELVERPKMGFMIPFGDWIRGPLRDWAEDLLSEDRLRREGYFHPAPIREKWAQHLSGQRNWPYHLWDVLMFQAWLAHRQHS